MSLFILIIFVFVPWVIWGAVSVTICPPPSSSLSLTHTHTHTPTAHLVLDSHCAVVLSGRGQKRRGWGTARGAHSLLRLTLRLLLSFSKHQSFLSRFFSLSLHPSLKRWKFAFVPSPATLPLCIRPPLYPWNYLLAFSFSAGSLHATRWLALSHHIISPPCTPLSLSLSISLSLSQKDCCICGLILSTPLSLSLSLSTLSLSLSLFQCHCISLSTSYKVHLSLHYMVSVVLWSFYLQSKHRGLCCSPHHADGSEMMAEMPLFSLLFREPLSQPLKALFEADRKHSKREKLLDRHAKTLSTPPFFFGYESSPPPLWLGWSLSVFLSLSYLSIHPFALAVSLGPGEMTLCSDNILQATVKYSPN